MPESEASQTAIDAHDLARRALSLARAGLLAAIGLFSLLAALCVRHGV